MGFNNFVLQAGSVRSLGMGFAFALVFLMPGLIFVKLAKRGERKVEAMTRLDKIAYALAGSWSSLVVIFSIHYLRGFKAFGLFDLPALSAAAFLIFIGLQSVVSGGIGYLWGRLLNYNREDGKTKTLEDREQPWKYIANKIRQEKVKIVTSNGHEIHGVVSRYGSGTDAGDITLGSPRFIVRSGSSEIDDYTLGNEAYISSSDIAQIHYNDEEYIVDDTEERVPDDFPSDGNFD